MRTILLAMALACAAVQAMADLAKPDGRVLVTIAGDIHHTNRGALPEGTASLLGFQDVVFETAAELDQALLDSLPQQEVEALDPTGTVSVTFSGPSLDALLGLLGASGAGVSVSALDGYMAEISAEEIATHAPILATRIDGRLMGIGAHGPAMVVFVPSGDAETDEALSAKQVWAVVFINVQ